MTPGTAPSGAEVVKKTDESPDLIEQIYTFLNTFKTLDKRLQSYLEANPDVSKALYYQTHEIGADYETEEARIDEQELIEEMGVGQKAMMLLNEFFGGALEKEEKGLVRLAPIEEAKAYYRALGSLKETNAPHEVEGYPHMILPERISRLDPFDYYHLATDKDKQTKVVSQFRTAEMKDGFPFPLGARVVLNREISGVVLAVLEKKAKDTGNTVSLLLPGKVDTAPAKNECQIVLAPSGAAIGETIDWKLIDLYVPIWENKEVPAMGWSPELVAAIYVRKGQTPEAACATAGMKPEPKFLEQLRTTPVAPSESAVAEASASADDLDEPN